MEKHSKDDKLSILDVKAQLDDGTSVLIEMHRYDLFDLKYKTIRSWARTYFNTCVNERNMSKVTHHAGLMFTLIKTMYRLGLTIGSLVI